MVKENQAGRQPQDYSSDSDLSETELICFYRDPSEAEAEFKAFKERRYRRRPGTSKIPQQIDY